MWGRGGVFTGFCVGKPERKNAHGRPWRGWEDIIKMDLKDLIEPEESSPQLHTLFSFEYFSPVHSRELQGPLVFIFTRQTFVCIK